MPKKWDNRKYLIMKAVGLRADKLSIEFSNGDVVQVVCSTLHPAGVDQIQWAQARISSDHLHLIVPAVPTNIEVAWYVIRSLTDSDFAGHMAESAARQAEYIGARLRQLRKQRKLTQAHVASAAKIEPANLSRIESGYFDVSTSTLWKVLAAMGYSPADLALDDTKKAGNYPEWLHHE